MYRGLFAKLTTIVLSIACFVGRVNAEDMRMTENLLAKLYITIDENTVSATMEDNVATRALVAALQEGSITYNAGDYGGFEKVGALGFNLPSEDEETVTRPGDIVLYNGNQIVIFYGTNSWSYTRIGHIDNSSEESVKSFLKAGKGSVTVRLSSDTTTGLEYDNTKSTAEKSFMVSGNVAPENYKGIVIEDGKKKIRR